MIFLVKRFYIIIILILLQGMNSCADGWELVKDKNSIKIYTRQTEGSSFKTYKGEATLKIGIQQLYDILIDVDHYDQWVYECSESRLLSKVENSEYTYYSIMRMPFPFENREMTTRMKVSFSNDTIRLSTRLINGTQTKKKGLVGMTAYDEVTTLIKAGDENVRMVMEGYFEPGGTLPAWLVNLFLSAGPYESLMSIKKLYEK